VKSFTGIAENRASMMATRMIAATAGVFVGVGMLTVPTAGAYPESCSDGFCTPGINGGVDIGASCGDTAYYVFGTTSWGRLVFSGSCLKEVSQ
jgi:hypothetical protein